MTCRNVVKRIEISPDLLQDDPEMIEDLIAAAMNDAARQGGEPEANYERSQFRNGSTTWSFRFVLRNLRCLATVLISLYKRYGSYQVLDQKSAQRMALHLIMKNKEGAIGLAHALNEATLFIHECSICQFRQKMKFVIFVVRMIVMINCFV